jgi:DNA-binding response OmpR family regulator
MVAGQSVLVIDDEPAVHSLIQVILEKEGFRLLGRGGRRFVDEAAEHRRPDLIILDILMPEVNGLEILQGLKMDQETKDIPVIVLTVASPEEEMNKALDLGADVFITKPFEPRELVEAVRGLLSGPGLGREPGETA